MIRACCRAVAAPAAELLCVLAGPKCALYMPKWGKQNVPKVDINVCCYFFSRGEQLWCHIYKNGLKKCSRVAGLSTKKKKT